MTKKSKRDILLHFDEEKNEIIIYTVSTKDTSGIRAKEFDGARLDMKFLAKMPPEEAEQTLGDTIFSLIDTFSERKTGIRPYEALIDESHQLDISQWESGASDGDPAAQFLLFIEYHARALFDGDAEALGKAEIMLKASASQGYPQAVERENDWPMIRAEVEKKIKRASSA